MKKLDYKILGDMIQKVYLDVEKFQMSKDVPAFKKDGKYVGDFFNFTMLELDGENPPIFYHIFSPYDVISCKSSQYAATFRSGEMILNLEFTPYMLQRTGVMSALVLQGLGYDMLTGKKVLYIGTGRIARHDLEALKAFFPEIKAISFVNQHHKSEEFIQFAKQLDIVASECSMDNLEEFDVIICHTSSKEAILTADRLSDIKQNAVITTFSSEDFTEVATEYFDTSQANILVDWEQTIDEAPELGLAVKEGRAKKSEVTTLKDLFSSGLDSRKAKKFTIYRSHGTPMQNLAAMKLIASTEIN